MVLTFGLKTEGHQKQTLVLEKGQFKGTKRFRECPIRKKVTYPHREISCN